MRYRAEVFDKLQYLYEVTKFNDHQLHFVIRFDGNLNANVMGKAIMLLLQEIPVLSCRYRHDGGDDYWEDVDSSSQLNDVFAIVNSEAEFEQFITSKTDELKGPQIKVCQYCSEHDSISITMNHMICDAAGFKQCLYLLAGLYSNLMENPKYSPGIVIDGDRGVQGVIAELSFWDKAKILLFQGKDSNQKSTSSFPMSTDENTAPFILTHVISSERYTIIHDYCKRNQVTFNDVVLTVYYRALSRTLNMDGKVLSIPIMVDMRKYLKESSFTALTNLSSMVITQIAVNPSESFEDTQANVHSEMNRKKANQIGMNGFVKLVLTFKLCTKRISYRLIRNHLQNPNICMTNIGILDSDKLVFRGTPAASAFMCGSIKYRPHFQIALSSFANEITFSSNLYGSKQDCETISAFFELLDSELPRI